MTASTLLTVVYGVTAGGAVWLALMAIKHGRTPPEDNNSFYGFDDEDDS